MRTLFWILVLANVILFAVMQRGGLGGSEPGYQPQPALHQEKILLLDASQNLSGLQTLPASQNPAVKTMHDSASSAIPASAPGPLSTSSPPARRAPAANTALLPTPALVASPSPAASPASAANQTRAAAPPPLSVKQRNLVCLEWGDFSGTDLKRATDLLSAMQLGDKLSQREIQYDKGYWVYIPPLKNRAAANKKIAQLKSLGIKEYFIVQESGSFRHAISLGVFKTEETAQNYLNELHAKGVSSARIGERASKLKTTMFVLNNVDTSIEGKLTAAKKDFPGSELKSTPCTLTR